MGTEMHVQKNQNNTYLEAANKWVQLVKLTPS